ncbi:MAG: NAD(P)-dependent glycerol-3-phosphate dehydrogenase [Candidatus Omnitrophica bacterium]|nr:NAD(P)-dependent glycerol-3-phosphate dehydrogenase [Candidatus Omnitrophota bacterium]
MTAVIGAGAWGTTLALLLARKGRQVILYEKFPDYGKVLMQKRENPKFLPGIKLPDEIKITVSLEDVKEAGLFILAPPSFAFRETASNLFKIKTDGFFLIATKGLEEGTGLRMSEVLRSEMGRINFAVLSGPTIARELAAGLPASAICAGENENLNALCQDILNSEKFRIYTSPDPIGCELGGALKNPLAIAAGIVEGLGLGENTKAALLCRGLAEIARLGKALGGKEKTIFGLSGLGDLITTASSPASRNHSFGLAIGRGEDPKSLIASQESVVEGYYTIRPSLLLSEKTGCEMPISTKIAEVLFNNKKPAEAVRELMTRPLKNE